MANERHEENRDPKSDLENIEVTELDDKDLEEASGGGGFEDSSDSPVNVNCGC